MFILASASPRRYELLQRFNLTFSVQPAQVNEAEIAHQLQIEEGNRTLPAAKLVLALAKAKAQAVSAQNPQALVLAADTVVVLEEEILGKPQNTQEAESMLYALSGKWHTVYSGVCLLDQSKEDLFYESCRVKFRPLDNYQKAAIAAYIKSGQPLDKAGAYGIQDMGAEFVEKIEGDYYTVVGLPLSKTRKLLYDRGLGF